MKPAKTAPTKVTRISKTMLIIFSIVFVLSLSLLLFFLTMYSGILETSGLVTRTSYQSVPAGRKSAVEKEWLELKYTIGTKEYTGKTLRRTQGGSAYKETVPVYYYPAIPSFAWYYTRANKSMLYCWVLLIFAAFFFVISVREVLVEMKRLQTPVPIKGKSRKK
jgi:hypothetical protein